jgi:hypothetical protein
MKTNPNLSQLIQKGYCVFPRVLNLSLKNRLIKATNKLLDNLTDKDKELSGSQGSIFDMTYQDPAFQDLIFLPKALESLKSLGFTSVKYWSGYVIAREPLTESSYWHQDWIFWGEKESRGEYPHQLFLMYYLTSTNKKNGCLRVIPGSHHKRCSAHDSGSGHDSGVRYEDPKTSLAYDRHHREIDVPIKSGDLLIGDARILHSTNSNETDQRRTVMTLWFLPRYNELSDIIKRGFSKYLYKPLPDSLSSDQMKKMKNILIDDMPGSKIPEFDRTPIFFINNINTSNKMEK